MAGLADLLRDFTQSASNSIAGNVTAPVDGIAWALRKAGVPVPPKPMGGSDWMAEKGLTRTVQPGLAQVPASHVTSWPDSLLEFGYYPPK